MLASINPGAGDAVARHAGAHALAHSQSSGSLNAQTDSHLTLVTSEGDRVTLSAQAQMAYRFGQFELNVVSDQGMLSMAGSGLDYMQMSGFEIQVQGDLNEQELADIQQLLGAFKKSINEFLDGDLAGAISAARSTPDALLGLDTIAAFDYTFSLNAEAQFRRSQSVTLSIPEPAEPPRTGARERANDNLSTARNTRDAERDVSTPAPNYRITPPSLDSLAARLSEQVEELRLNQERFQELVPRVLQRAIGELRSESVDEDRKAALDSIGDQIVARFEPPATSDPNYRATRQPSLPDPAPNFSARA